jgi:tetratricopeptide (TPR) repeat protein
MNNTIYIFLASSNELESDRQAIRNLIDSKNKLLQQEDTFIHLNIWEDFIDAVSQTRLQDEYNKKIQAADIFIMLFFTKVGMYTSEEFDKALEQFKKANKPLIYTYFKTNPTKISKIPRENIKSLWAFQDKLKDLGHFQTEYEAEAELVLHISQQLDKLFVEGTLKKGKPKETTLQTPKCLSAGQPAVTTDFLGRDTELADIQSKLTANSILLINGEGGMGKTTLAAKYLNNHLEHYKHFAWLFCDNGIIEEIKTLTPTLNVDLAQYPNEADQLLAIKTAMENLGTNCLLILDNANESEHIKAFQKHFGGLHWHVLLTSRCQQVLPGNEYPLNHLKPDEARRLFKTYHDESTVEFEALLDKFLTGIGYNTLMIELFSKNIHELTAVGETLADALQQFKEKGLFLGERSFEVHTSWTGNVHKEAATTDKVLEVLYDLTKLEEEERKLLVNLALLPAESHHVSLLIEALTPEDKIAFAKQLKSLAQKGWLNTDGRTYRISPVVQQIVLAKNKNGLQEDVNILISNLNYKLENDGLSLKNLKSYAEAQPFAELAKSVTSFLQKETFETALLSIHLSDYYTNIGNYKAALIQLNKATTIFEKISKVNYSVCLERLGDIYRKQGNFKKALQFFEQYNDLCKELYEANPHSESLKTGLAISYSKLGNIYQQQGDLEKGLQFFEQYNSLRKELYEANPYDELFKYGLAVSYSKLGDIYQKKGDFKKALQFFEMRALLGKELNEANQNNASLKNGLAISYERLGDIYKRQGDFKKALQFFEQYNSLRKELYEANPDSVSLYNGLAISYTNLGEVYFEMGEWGKAKDYYQQAAQIWTHLTEKVPEAVEYQNNLGWVKEQLEGL